jgi:hypothetical protein
MLIKAFNRLKSDGKPELVSRAATSSSAHTGGISRMVTSAGRISLNMLLRTVQTFSREDFIRFIQRPVLAGSAVHHGTLSAARTESGSQGMNRTILFEPLDETEETDASSEGLKHAIYSLVKGEFATSTGNIFTIGRIDGNDLIMPDYAISKKHAIIEFKRGSYMLKDCGSTNGTMLKDERIQSKPVELHDGDIISFARYEFIFLHPGSLYGMLKIE